MKHNIFKLKYLKIYQLSWNNFSSTGDEPIYTITYSVLFNPSILYIQGCVSEMDIQQFQNNFKQINQNLMHLILFKFTLLIDRFWNIVVNVVDVYSLSNVFPFIVWTKASKRHTCTFITSFKLLLVHLTENNTTIQVDKLTQQCTMNY